MNLAALLALACLLPAPVKLMANRIIAQRKADPEHWQTTPIPPIAMSRQAVISEDFGKFVKQWSAANELRPDEDAKSYIDRLLRAYNRDRASRVKRFITFPK